MSPCRAQNCFTDTPLCLCAEIRARQSSLLDPSFLATVDLVMEPLWGLANGIGRGVHRTLTIIAEERDLLEREKSPAWRGGGLT